MTHQRFFGRQNHIDRRVSAVIQCMRHRIALEHFPDIGIPLSVRKSRKRLQMIRHVVPESPDLEMLLFHRLVVCLIHLRKHTLLFQFPLTCQRRHHSKQS